jgi:hypothetical protein
VTERHWKFDASFVLSEFIELHFLGYFIVAVHLRLRRLNQRTLVTQNIMHNIAGMVDSGDTCCSVLVSLFHANCLGFHNKVARSVFILNTKRDVKQSSYFTSLFVSRG